MSEGRGLVNPKAITLGARPLTVPGRGPVLVASVVYAFRLSDGEHIRPETWYERVATHASPTTVPDSLCALPGAELLILGPLPAPKDNRKVELQIQCGAIDRTVTVRRDEETDSPIVTLSPERAVWHKEDNPGGAGGPDDKRRPLIEDPDRPERPIWLGPTPIDHPMRMRLAGEPEKIPMPGWPSKCDPAILYEAHGAFWTDSLHPAERLLIKGDAIADIDCRLPPYRVALTSGDHDASVRKESVRIHTLAVLPAAGIGAVIWRAPVAVRDNDMMGDRVVTLIAALEDAAAPETDPEDWMRLAVDRWTQPVKMLDDRPLLPPAMAKTMPAPFAMPKGHEAIDERHKAASDWAMGEMPVDENPFAGKTPQAEDLAKQAAEASENEDTGPDTDAMEGIAASAMAASRQRHADAGFDDAPPSDVRLTRRRDHMLDAEIRRRLDNPYQSEIELGMMKSMTQIKGAHAFEPEETLAKLNDARLMSPAPALHWDALEEDEARIFGNQVAQRLESGPLGRHHDVSGALIGDQDEATVQITSREFDGTLAEETTWRNTHFKGCAFKKASFVRGSFEGCTFEMCSFEGTNLSSADMVNSTWRDCTFEGLSINEPTWYECTFERCDFTSVSMSDMALTDVVFEKGRWHQVTWADAIAIRMTWRDIEFEETTFAQVHAPEAKIEKATMLKVSVMGLGFCHSVLEDIEATHCGFLSKARFDSSTLSRCKFVMTGFTNAIFSESVIDRSVLFENCDLSGAMFINAKMMGVRTTECALAGSRWKGVDASEAWFHAARLRGVDFDDTELFRAVFADADIDGTIFMPDKTIGADFRGTVRAAA